jgi:hypothetical protein
MMKHATFMLALLAACNQVYGLEPTQLPNHDAAPSECPPVGTAPRFGAEIQQAVAQPCTLYRFNTTGTLATAVCSTLGTVVGTRDAPLTKAAGLPELISPYSDPRPAPARRRIYMRERITSPTISNAIVAFDEDGAGSWSLTEKLPIPITGAENISTVFLGSGSERVIVTDANLKTMTEYAAADGTWSPVGDPHAFLPRFLGGTFSVTTDGLRAVYASNDGKELLYVDRTDVESWFGEPRPLAGAPFVYDAHLADDCTRLYYSGLDSIFFSSQI